MSPPGRRGFRGAESSARPGIRRFRPRRRLDLLITTNQGAAYLYRNEQLSGNRGLRLRLIGTKSNRDAIGAVARVFGARRHAIAPRQIRIELSLAIRTDADLWPRQARCGQSPGHRVAQRRHAGIQERPRRFVPVHGRPGADGGLRTLRRTVMSAASMRAVQAVQAGGAFEVTNLPIPEPGPDQVRVRVHACGVCAGDNLARLGLMRVQLPRVPGHEVAGVVDAVGPGVRPQDCRHLLGRRLCRVSGGAAGCPGAHSRCAVLRGSGADDMRRHYHVQLAPAFRRASGDTVAVHGIGGLGHLAIQFADKMGFRTVAINRGSPAQVDLIQGLTNGRLLVIAADHQPRRLFRI